MQPLNPMEIHYLGNLILNKTLADRTSSKHHFITLHNQTEQEREQLASQQQRAHHRIEQLQNSELAPYIFKLINCDDQSEVILAGNTLEFVAISKHAVIFGQFNSKTWEQTTYGLRRLMTDGVYRGMCYNKERASDQEAERLLAPTKPYLIDSLVDEYALPAHDGPVVIEVNNAYHRDHPLSIDLMFAISSLSRHKVDGCRTDWQGRKLIEHRFVNFDYSEIDTLPLEQL